MVRVGPNVKESLSPVALDTLAKKRQARRDIHAEIYAEIHAEIYSSGCTVLVRRSMAMG